MTEPALYDRIGAGYAAHRRPDPRVQARIEAVLGDARTVLNVGAGTGSYEPTNRLVVAVERSLVMIDGRPPGSAPVVQGAAEALPFADQSFAVAMALMTVHHWDDWRAGLAELQRVSLRQVLFVLEPELHNRFWLIEEYFPAVLERELPSLRSVAVTELVGALGGPDDVEVVDIPITYDFADAVLWANWRRPEAYLDPAVLRCNSTLAQLPPDVRDAGAARLAADLESGAWHQRHADLLTLDEIDGGFRLLVTGAR